MLQPRTLDLKGAEQGAKRAAAVGLELERRAAIQARRMRVKKGADLLLEEVLLEGTEEVFGLSQGQPEMLDALAVLVERLFEKSFIGGISSVHFGDERQSIPNRPL